ncbi:unnamed protein product [Mytilus coruscus]|uniref:Ion transport domain-containing protein n=1 Tax=Mytilus coruscus TaxID=42192 RepID=A0A6J8BSX2_MYTCO|nr:unnamed protein product [Mytilus coruscus]
MFSFVLTRDLQTKISILEGMLFFYIVGDLLEELWSMIRPEDCSWSFQRVLLYLILASGDTGCTNNVTLWKNDPSVSRCPTSDWLPPVIAATYMMLTNWLLLNIVIAMFSARFDLIKTKSSQKWRYHRHSVVIEYEHKIPSPLNIPFRVLIILAVVICYVPCLFICGCDEENYTDPGMLQKQREFAKVIIEEEKEEEHIKQHVE